MNVTLLYFDDCPNWIVADERLRTLAAEFPGFVIERRIVDTVEDAEATRFRGSPSIIIDGIDAFAESDAPIGLSCRRYQTPGGLAGSPTLDQLRSELAMHAIETRAATPDDADAVEDYHDRCFKNTYSSQLLAGAFNAPDREGTRQQFRDWFRPGSEFVTQVAVVDGTPIGHSHKAKR